MTLEAALAEAYASGNEDAVDVWTLEVDHPSLSTAIRLVRSVDGAMGDPGETIPLPLVEGGPKVPHIACAFSFVSPGADQDGPTDGNIQIDNVSDLLHDLLEGMIGYNAEILVTFRQYLVMPGQLAAVTGPDDDTFSGLEMTIVDLPPDSAAKGTIAWPDGRAQNVPTGPHAFFNRDEYPGLFS